MTVRKRYGVDGKELPGQEQAKGIMSVHPVYKMPSDEEIVAMHEAGVFKEYMEKREEMIHMEKVDPFNWGVDWRRAPNVFGHWKDVDEVMDDPDVDIVYIFGGNRGGKTQYAARTLLRLMVNNPKYNAWCCHSSSQSSIQVQQPIVYHYLPLEWKDQKRAVRSVLNVGFSQKNGFSGGTFVGINHAQCWFKNYTQDLETMEGGELDLIWMDELVQLNWIETLKYRTVTRKGKLLITFTPIEGYTPTVKDALDGCTIVETRPAQLLKSEERSSIKGVPPGHMPYKAITRGGNGVIFWFFSEWNPYSPFDQLERTMRGRTREEREIRGYGYVSNPITGKFPRFGASNIVKEKDIPKQGTNYMVIDPTGGDRNWFMLWLRADDVGRLFVYREWPDWKRYGEWALASHKADGKKGPAQTTDCGRNLPEYKKLILELEKNDAPMADRYIDPRAGKTAILGTKERNLSLIELLAKPEDGDSDNKTSLYFTPAPGASIDEGCALVNNLFAYNSEEPISVLNEPKLYISEECRNLIYSLNTWTGEDGEKGASKDPVDALRYLILMDPVHIEGAGLQAFEGGSY